MLSALFLTHALLTSLVFATPTNKERLAQRRENHAARRGGPLLQSSKLSKDASAPIDQPTWAGAAFLDTYPNGTFTGIQGTFNVPTPSTPEGGSGPYAGSVWVGIDGVTCDSAIWQTGIDYHVDGDEVSYDAWYEWWPNPSVYWNTSISFSAGDEVALTITVESPTSGTATIENLTNGQSVTETLAVNATYPLCQQNADWIVEDYFGLTGAVPLANFSAITFKDACATTTFGSVGPETAAIWDMEQNDVVLTSVSVTQDSVTITHT